MDKKDIIKTKSIGAFKFRVVVRGPDECWPWQGASRCRVVGIKTRKPQAVAWCLSSQEQVPSGMDVGSTCGSSSCCNPKHLHVVRVVVSKKRRSGGMRLLVTDIREEQMQWLKRESARRDRPVAYLVREALTTAFRSAEGSEGRATPVAVSENPTES